jgi:hypothetical protein
MVTLDEFAEKCGQWNDQYLLEEWKRGAAAYDRADFYVVVEAEVARRGLSQVTASTPPTPVPAYSQQPLPQRLWQGNVALAETYWVWGVGINLVLSVLIGIASEKAPAVLLLSLFALAYWVFIAVAIWRSASHYAGREVWAALAKAAVVLGTIRMMVSVFGLVAVS